MTSHKLLYVCVWVIAVTLVCGTELFSLQHSDPKYQASTTYNGQRYRLSKGHRASHSESLRLCKEDASILITIKSQNVTDVVVEMLNNTLWRSKDTYVNSIWIGLIMDSQYTGVWSDGSHFDNRVAEYTNWEKLEPKTPTKSKCISLWYQRQWHWDDAYCKGRVFYICEDRVPKITSSVQLNNISKDTAELASKNIINSYNLDTLLASLDKLLGFKQCEIDKSGISRRDILRTIAIAINKYDVTKERYVGNGRNIIIRAADLCCSRFGFSYNTSKNSQLVTSSITLTKECIQELQQKTNSSPVKASSVLFRKSSLFSSANTFSLNNVKLLKDTFQCRQCSTIVSPVISMDIQDIGINDLQSAIIVRHQTFISINSSELSNSVFSSQNKAREAILKHENLGNFIERDFTFKCVSWDFNKNFVGSGGWSESGCHLSSFSIVNGNVVATCVCNHIGNYAFMLEITKSPVKDTKMKDENLQMLLLGMAIGFVMVLANYFIHWLLGTVIELKIYLRFMKVLLKFCHKHQKPSPNDPVIYCRLSIVRTVVEV